MLRFTADKSAKKPFHPIKDPGSNVLEFDRFYFEGYGLLSIEEAKAKGLIPEPPKAA